MTAGLLLQTDRKSLPYCNASDFVRTLQRCQRAGQDSTCQMTSKLTGLQRYTDSARSTDAGDSPLTSWQKALLFGLVGAAYEPHELTHGVAVVVWRPEGMLCNSPPWREDHKVCHCRACASGTAVWSAAAAAAATAEERSSNRTAAAVI